MSGTGNEDRLKCSYTVQDGDESPDLAATALALSENATLTDVAGNTANLSLASATTLQSAHAIVVDGVRPRLTRITRFNTQEKTDGDSSTLKYTVTFSEPVLGVTASNFAVLTGAGVTGTPTIDTPSGSGATWTVTLSKNGATGTGASDSMIELVLANPTGITDIVNTSAGNAMQNVAPTGGAGQVYILDTKAATILSVSTTTLSGSYKAEASIPIQVTFSEPVTVTGAPKLTVETGDSDRDAICAAATASFTVTCTYTVVAGDTSADLDYVATTSLALSGGTIKDSAGLDANLSLPTPGTSTSLAGSTNTDGTAKTIVIDTTAPLAPTLSLASYDSGVASDRITSQPDIVLAVTAELGSTVAITAMKDDSTVTLSSGSVQGTGAPQAFSPRTGTGTNLVALVDGTYRFTAVATDVAGNASPSSSLLEVTIDTTPPVKPSGLALTPATDTGASSSDGITKATEVSITGTAPIDTTVELYANGLQLGEATTSATGTFTVSLSLSPGSHSITAEASDVAANSSDPSSALLVVVDQVGPGVVIAAPVSGGYIATATPSFKAIALDQNGVSSVQFMARKQGGDFANVGAAITSAASATYSVTAPASLGTDGTYEVKALATDVAGNESDSGSTTFVIDTTAPTVSVVSPVAGVSLRSLRPTFVATVADSNSVVAVGFGVKIAEGNSFTDISGTLTNVGQTYTLVPTADLGSDGSYQVVVIAKDIAGNRATSAPTSFTISTVPPPSSGDTTPEVVQTVPATSAPIVVQVPVAAAPRAATVIPSVSPIQITAPPGLSTESLTKALAAIPGGLTREAAASVTTALTIVEASTAQSFVSNLGALPPTQAAEIVNLLVSGTPEEAKATVQFISTLAPGTEVARGVTSVAADGKETKTFSLDDEASAGNTTIDGVEVAGVRSATANKRSVAILVKGGQVARISRGRSGIWPDLTFPLLGGKLSGVAPVIALPTDATTIVFEPIPSGLSSVQQGSLGGGNVVPLGLPFSFRVESTSRQARVQFSLPSIRVGEGQTLAYLHSIASASGSFVGYVRAPAEFDSTTSRQTWTLSAGEVSDLLLLPAILQSAYVQNFKGEARIFSGPDEYAVDFGEAGPAFTTFIVVGPQVGGRIFVFSPVSRGYGWIDASGVGPSGPPID
jgi:hypothetical protein